MSYIGSDKSGGVRDKQDASILKCVAQTIFTVSLVGGATAVGIAAWTIVDRIYMTTILGSELLYVASWIMGVTGIFVMLITILAYVATCIAQKQTMVAYTVLQLLAFLFLIVSGVLAVVFKMHINGDPRDLRDHMQHTLEHEYGAHLENSRNRAVTDSWDDTQTRLRCCAVDDQSWYMYRQSEWYKITPPQDGKKLFVPLSCCFTYPNGEYLDELRCQTNTHGPPGQDTGAQNDALYYRGCFGASQDKADHQADFILGTSFCCAVVACLPALLFGFYMAGWGIPGINEVTYSSKKYHHSRGGTNQHIMYPMSTNHATSRYVGNNF